MPRKYLLIAIILFGVMGCARMPEKTVLNITTDPEGAMISEVVTGISAGSSPARAIYETRELAKHKDQRGCYRVNGFVASWISGAKNSTSSVLTMCPPNNGLYNISIKRKPTDPDLQSDLDYATNRRQAIFKEQVAIENQQKQMAYQQAQMQQQQPELTQMQMEAAQSLGRGLGAVIGRMLRR